MNKPTKSTAECETTLGPRGRLTVTSDNRREVRKWLNSQGFPALFSGGLSMRELGLAYNDTSGRELEKLRRKLAEVAGTTEDDATETPAGEATIANPATEGTQQRPGRQGNLLQTIADQPARTRTIAGRGEVPDTRPQAGENGEGQPARGAQPQAGNGQQAPQPQGQTPSLDDAARALFEALKGQNGRAAMDEDRVREIAREEDRNLWAEVQTLFNDNAARNLTTIEVRLPNADSAVRLEGHHHPQFATLLKAAAARDATGRHLNIWLSGPAGSGKTFGAHMAANALQKEFHYNGALSMPHELLGFIDAGGTYHQTAFFKGYTANAVYLFDEVDGSDNSALLALNAALANGRATFPSGAVERHEGSVIICTANTWGLGATADYVGRTKLDAAFLSRFPVRIFWDYDTQLEKQICGNAQWAERVQKARANARRAGIKVLIDPRASIAGAALIAQGFTSDETAALTYLANLTAEQKTMVERAAA